MVRTLSAVAREVGGELVGEDSAFEGVSIASRELESGSLLSLSPVIGSMVPIFWLMRSQRARPAQWYRG